MRRSILVLAAALAAAAVSGAADAAPAATYDWNGAYVGAFAGVASGRSDAVTDLSCPTGGYLCAPGIQEDNGAWVNQVGTTANTAIGFTGGGFAGRNWQNGSFVYGFEADVGAMALKVTNGGTATTVNEGLYNGSDPTVFSMTTTASADWLASARARVGFLPSANLLLYGTAGIAATGLTVANAFADNFIVDGGAGARESASRSEFRAALVVGVGAEWAMSARWRLRAEYLHADFGSLDATGGVSYPGVFTDVNAITGTADLRADMVRVGIVHGF